MTELAIIHQSEGGDGAPALQSSAQSAQERHGVRSLPWAICERIERVRSAVVDPHNTRAKVGELLLELKALCDRAQWQEALREIFPLDDDAAALSTRYVWEFQKSVTSHQLQVTSDPALVARFHDLLTALELPKGERGARVRDLAVKYQKDEATIERWLSIVRQPDAKPADLQRKESPQKGKSPQDYYSIVRDYVSMFFSSRKKKHQSVKDCIAQFRREVNTLLRNGTESVHYNASSVATTLLQHLLQERINHLAAVESIDPSLAGSAFFQQALSDVALAATVADSTFYHYHKQLGGKVHTLRAEERRVLQGTSSLGAECPYPNHTWVHDYHKCKGWLWDPQEQDFFQPWLSAWLDDRSRVVMGAALCRVENVDGLHGALFNAMRRSEDARIPFCGMAENLWMDNGYVQKSKFILQVCQRFGMNPKHSEAYAAWKKKVERWFRTLHEQWEREFFGVSYRGKSDRGRSMPEIFAEGEVRSEAQWRKLRSLALRGEIRTLEEANASLENYLIGKYHQQPHKGLKGFSPAEFWVANCPERLRKVPDESYLIQMLLPAVGTRLVRRLNIVEVQGLQFLGDVDTLLPYFESRSPVEVRIVYGDMRRILLADPNTGNVLCWAELIQKPVLDGNEKDAVVVAFNPEQSWAQWAKQKKDAKRVMEEAKEVVRRAERFQKPVTSDQLPVTSEAAEAAPRYLTPPVDNPSRDSDGAEDELIEMMLGG